MVRSMQIFVFITNMIFVPHIFGPWLPDTNDLQFEPGTEISCADWLIRSGFHESDIVENIRRARFREKTNDNTAFFWAVIYAQFLIAFPAIVSNQGLWTPAYFCDKQKWFTYKRIPFEAFESKNTICEMWIEYYAYKYDFSSIKHDHAQYRINRFYNFDVAQSRNEAEDESISLWATVYALFLTSYKRKKAITIHEFCLGVSPAPKSTRFMSLNDKPLNCKEWIYLYGFYDFVDSNINMAKREHESFQKFKKFINHWARIYFEELINSEKKPNTFGCGSSTSIMASEYTARDKLKPSEFCKDRGFPDDVPVKYFG